MALAPFVSAPAAAQEAFDRPRLPFGSDPNDWESYYDFGVRELVARRPERAEPAFYWASRLNPERAEPLFLRWVSFHLRDEKRWIGYLDGREKVLSSPAVVAMDSVRFLAMVRNPFVHRGLELILWDEMPGRFREDTFTRAWLAYSEPDFPEAAELFGRAIERRPEQLVWARMLRAQAFVMMQRYDSALAELETLRATLEERDRESLVVAYESKEMLHYAIGMLHAARRQPALARESMQRALGENLGFHPAHLFLGDLAFSTGDAASALADYEAALVIAPSDALLRYRHGLALSRLGRLDEAVASMRMAIDREPFYAAPWLELGRILDHQGDVEGALAAYSGFMKRAPEQDRGLAHARTRLASLRGAATARP